MALSSLPLPWSTPGQFFKGNLHTHSNQSDGAFSPEEVCRRYQEAGYDFIALTDHFLEVYGYPLTDTTAFRTKNFTTLFGAELHAGETEFGSIWHLLAVGLPLDFTPPFSGEDAAELKERARSAGAFVAAAHPAWYGLTERDLESLGAIDAIEVYNGVAIDHNDRPDSWHLTEIQLGRGQRFSVLTADDFHGTGERYDFQRGWVQVKAESREPDTLLESLKAGRYYSTTGPEIENLSVTDEAIQLTCTPAERVILSGKSYAAVALPGNQNTHFEIPLQAFNSPYGRVTIRDAEGNRAWTNPIWF